MGDLTVAAQLVCVPPPPHLSERTDEMGHGPDLQDANTNRHRQEERGESFARYLHADSNASFPAF